MGDDTKHKKEKEKINSEGQARAQKQLAAAYLTDTSDTTVALRPEIGEVTVARDEEVRADHASDQHVDRQDLKRGTEGINIWK